MKKVLLIAVALVMMASMANAWEGILGIRAITISGGYTLDWTSFGYDSTGMWPDLLEDSGFAPGLGMFSLSRPGSTAADRYIYDIYSYDPGIVLWNFVLVGQNLPVPPQLRVQVKNMDYDYYEEQIPFNLPWQLLKNGTPVTPIYPGFASDQLYDIVVDANAGDIFTFFCPVPEPGTMVALGSGLVGLVGFAIRRRK